MSHAPSWVTDQVQQIHHRARIGFDPWQPGQTGEGQFYLLQLFHRKDAEKTYSGYWNYRGPIFGKDFDRLTYTPITIAKLSHLDVYQGGVITKLKEWIIPIRKRIRENRETLGNLYDREATEISGAAGEELYWRAKKSIFGPQVVAKKFLTKEDKDVLCGDKMERDRIKMRESLLPKGDLG